MEDLSPSGSHGPGWPMANSHPTFDQVKQHSKNDADTLPKNNMTMENNHLKMHHLLSKYIKIVIFHCHVSFQGGKWSYHGTSIAMCILTGPSPINICKTSPTWAPSPKLVFNQYILFLPCGSVTVFDFFLTKWNYIQVILLMVQKSGRPVDIANKYPLIYRVLCIQTVVFWFFGFLNHQHV